MNDSIGARGGPCGGPGDSLRSRCLSALMLVRSRDCDPVGDLPRDLLPPNRLKNDISNERVAKSK